MSKIQPNWVWKGPRVDGVTQSILKEFLTCRERCRVKLKLGLQAAPEFNIKLLYGTLFHAALEGRLDEELSRVVNQYPEHLETLAFWYRLIRCQVESYNRYWQTNAPEVVVRFPEYVFDQRVDGYRLRGKVDAIIEVAGECWLLERKTVSQIDESELIGRVSYDLQTGFYLVAIGRSKRFGRIGGILYDVIRRPLSGGRYSYRQRAGESPEEYIRRIVDTFEADPGHYFARFSRAVTPSEVRSFYNRTLRPLLRELERWYLSDAQEAHWVMPLGLYPRRLDAIDEYIQSEGRIQLGLVEYRPFRELEPQYDDGESSETWREG